MADSNIIDILPEMLTVTEAAKKNRANRICCQETGKEPKNCICKANVKDFNKL